MKHAITWFEIPVSDIDRATSFYQEIFDFKMQRMDFGDQLKMALFPSDSGSVGGALVEHKGFYTPGVQGGLIYLNADPDLNAVLDRLKMKNANIIQDKKLISETHGYMALFEDCEGNRIGLMSSR